MIELYGFNSMKANKLKYLYSRHILLRYNPRLVYLLVCDINKSIDWNVTFTCFRVAILSESLKYRWYSGVCVSPTIQHQEYYTVTQAVKISKPKPAYGLAHKTDQLYIILVW